MNCDKCMHSGLCLYEDGARAFEKSVNEVEKPALISTKIECSKFHYKFVPKKTPAVKDQDKK